MGIHNSCSSLAVAVNVGAHSSQIFSEDLVIIVDFESYLVNILVELVDTSLENIDVFLCLMTYHSNFFGILFDIIHANLDRQNLIVDFFAR